MGTEANTLNQGSRNLVLVPPPGVSLQPWSEDLKEATEGLLLIFVPVSSLGGRPPPFSAAQTQAKPADRWAYLPSPDHQNLKVETELKDNQVQTPLSG